MSRTLFAWILTAACCGAWGVSHHARAEEVKEAAAKDPPTPTKVATDFFAAVHAGAADKALALSASYEDLRPKEEIEYFIGDAKEKGAGNRPTMIDEHVVGDVAIVVVGVEGKNYRAGLDIHPLCLERMDGVWKVLPARVPQIAFGAVFAATKDKDALGQQLLQLSKWYQERKEAIYVEREQNPAPK